MAFSSSDLNENHIEDAQPVISQFGDESTTGWILACQRGCSFTPEHFQQVMTNLLQNPNILSSWLFRADILHERDGTASSQAASEYEKSPSIPHFEGFALKKIVVRKLIPRNTKRDDPLHQTCLFYESLESESQDSLVVYLPHVLSEAEIPFYHPSVRGVAYLHKWNPSANLGAISVHYALFDDGNELSNKLCRTALNLLAVLHKHGEGKQSGYVKRVQHDTLVPQARLQDKYHDLKARYSRGLINGWLESTDPGKHVFEDLCIAAFLIEVWRDLYSDSPFPGFVDIGCGNGLLVYILNKEGYRGWGFDARARKSWAQYNTKLDKVPDLHPDQTEDSLRCLVLLPSFLTEEGVVGAEELPPDSVHDGNFPRGTFIISNHADELTPWTPILAAMSECPFIAIPCCSHDLGGAKFRAPPPRDKGASKSTYSSLVEWVADISRDCGWDIEREMLRIPSTRNTALIGRQRTASHTFTDVQQVIAKYGGANNYLESARKLIKTGPRSH